MLTLRSCHCCGLIQTAAELPLEYCARCHTRLTAADHQRDNRLAATLALSALILFLPAVTLPFLQISRFGLTTASSVLGGIGILFREGHFAVGSIVVVFSLIFPLLKLGLIFLLSTRSDWLHSADRSLSYRLVEHLGRWGMLDVLLVAVMIAFIKLGSLVAFGAGPGLPLFATFVIASLLASLAFNPHVLWSEHVMNTTDNSPPKPASDAPPSTPSAFPTAIGRPSPSRHRLWIWILPMLAFVAAGALTWNVIRQRGRLITITFTEGRGLAAGDQLRYRGIRAGDVESLELLRQGEGVVARVRITRDCDNLIRQGTQFWIVRPQLDVSGVSGLETLVGAKYLTFRPAPPQAPLTSAFAGLEEPPLADLDFPGGIEIVLQAPQARGLRAGLPLHYRHLRVGGIRKIALSADGGAIEATAYIRPDYAHLIRTNTTFWNASGVNLTGGLTGFHLHVGPAESWIHGGVELGIPPEVGDAVQTGHRFPLHPAAKQEWLEWSPAIASGPAPPASQVPDVVPVVLTWKHDGWLWDTDRSRRGLLMASDGLLLGPAELQTAPPDAIPGTARLQAGETTLSLKAPAGAHPESTLRQRQVEGVTGRPVTCREPPQPEDGFIVTGSGDSPVLLAATRIRVEDGHWRLDPELSLPGIVTGAPLLAATDRKVIGFLRIEGTDRSVIPYVSSPPAAE